MTDERRSDEERVPIPRRRLSDEEARELHQRLFPESANSPDYRAERAAKRAAAFAAKGKTDEAVVMALLAIEARLDSLGYEVGG
jgi:hypothetical protein